jgi:predicted nucleotidyltransferase
MAMRNFRAYLKGDTVVRKKYLYVLRPLLAANWIEKGLGIAPTEFDLLVARTVTDEDLRSEINELLHMKRAGSELDRGPPHPRIQAFIES